MQERLRDKILDLIKYDTVSQLYLLKNEETELALADMEKLTDQILQLFRDEVVGMKLMRNDNVKLPQNVNATERYNHEAHLNIVDGYNQVIDYILKKLEA